MHQQELVNRLGPSWCFTHGAPLPCGACQKIKTEHPFLGLCFDCKRENAADGEDHVERCGCGSMVRMNNFWHFIVKR